MIQGLPTIYYASCCAQITTSYFLGVTKSPPCCHGYDRFVEISSPLCYTIIMNIWVCIQLAVETWAGAFLVTLTPIIAIPAHYCGHNIINHFSYEIQALLKLVCLDTHASLILGLVISVFTLPLPFTFTLMSYFHIMIAMLQTHSVEARLKTFSICRSHLTVATIFYGIVIDMYLKLSQRNLRKKANSSQYFMVQLLPCLHPEK